MTFLIHLLMYLFSSPDYFSRTNCLALSVIFFPPVFFLFGKDVLRKYLAVCQVRLTIVTDHTYQFQHVYRLGIRKYLDVLGTINKRS